MDLSENRGARHQAPAGFGQFQLASTPVSRRGTSCDETLFYQPPNHHRNRALVSIGALGQLIDGAGRRGSKLLEHKELSASNSEVALG